MRVSKIYTHGFSAHVDDLLACALLLAVADDPQEVEVIRCREEELPKSLGEGEFIVDIGGVYDGSNHFDHHQDDEAVEGECAATLVAKHFTPVLLEDKVWGGFLQRVSVQDNNGMKAVDVDGAFRAGDFLVLERGLVSMFENRPQETAQIVAEMIRERLDYLKQVADAKVWLESHTEVFYTDATVQVMGEWEDPGEVTLDVAYLKVLEITSNPALAGIPSRIANAAQDELIRDNRIIVVLSWDPRDREGKRRTLFRTRYGEEWGFDFSSLTGDPRVAFAHKAGFLCNFTGDREDAKELIKRSRD